MTDKQTRKTDHRARLTKAIIREALIQLLEQKPVGDISIAELCRVAEVSRSTFYSHYSSPEDVLNSIQEEVVTRLVEETAGESLSTYEAMLLNCQISLENKDFLLVVARDHRARAMFRRRLLEMTTDIDEIVNFPENPTEEQSVRRFRALAASEGCAGIMNDWHERGMKEPPELVAQAVADFLATQQI